MRFYVSSPPGQPPLNAGPRAQRVRTRLAPRWRRRQCCCRRRTGLCRSTTTSDGTFASVTVSVAGASASGELTESFGRHPPRHGSAKPAPSRGSRRASASRARPRRRLRAAQKRRDRWRERATKGGMPAGCGRRAARGSLRANAANAANACPGNDRCARNRVERNGLCAENRLKGASRFFTSSRRGSRCATARSASAKHARVW